MWGSDPVFRAHSTRLFPKGQGAEAYKITGIASRCDWVLLTDRAAPQAHLVRRVETDQPRHIFLSMRSPFTAIPHFARHVLPTLTAPFVLVSGSEDATVPVQMDQRWRRFDASEQEAIQQVLDHPLLLHWVAENLDSASHPKLRPIPVGMVYNDEPKIRDSTACPTVPPTATRPLRVLCAHRTRPGPQWDRRKHVTEMAQTCWANWCTIIQEEISEAAFLALLTQHAFVFCVEGGGLDPSPKAWQAALHGSIPIVRQTALAPAYQHLPVAFVADWTPDALDPARLHAWLTHLAPHHDNADRRKEVLHRLSLEYWWDYVTDLARPA